MRELAQQAILLLPNADGKALKNLTAVDGSYFNSIAHTAWVLWSPEQPAAKLMTKINAARLTVANQDRLARLRIHLNR